MKYARSILPPPEPQVPTYYQSSIGTPKTRNKPTNLRRSITKSPGSLPTRPVYLRHLVVKSVTTSISRTAGRLTMTLTKERKPRKGKVAPALTAIREDETSIRKSSARKSSVRESSSTTKKTDLEKAKPKWDTPGWLDERFEVEGFCPAVRVSWIRCPV